MILSIPHPVIVRLNHILKGRTVLDIVGNSGQGMAVYHCFVGCMELILVARERYLSNALALLDGVADLFQGQFGELYLVVGFVLESITGHVDGRGCGQCQANSGCRLLWSTHFWYVLLRLFGFVLD